MLKVKSFLCSVLILMLLLSNQFFFQGTTDAPEKKTVVVMPFDYGLRFPFLGDDVRQSLINGFLKKDFKVINDENTWNSIMNLGYELVDMKNDVVDSLAAKLDVDLIAFGLTQKEVVRAPGAGGESEQPTQILIKVYDCNKQKIIYRDRIKLKTQWGIMNQNLPLTEFGNKVADIIRKMD